MKWLPWWPTCCRQPPRRSPGRTSRSAAALRSQPEGTDAQHFGSPAPAMATPTSSNQTVGIVGLGLVGQAIAARLHAAGIDTIGYDVRAEARAGFQAGAVAESPREIGEQATCVVLAVFDTAGVLDV